jgi:hypothetical protein
VRHGTVAVFAKQSKHGHDADKGDSFAGAPAPAVRIFAAAFLA